MNRFLQNTVNHESTQCHTANTIPILTAIRTSNLSQVDKVPISILKTTAVLPLAS
jgi:hypothetical protein